MADRKGDMEAEGRGQASERFIPSVSGAILPLQSFVVINRARLGKRSQPVNGSRGHSQVRGESKSLVGNDDDERPAGGNRQQEKRASVPKTYPLETPLALQHLNGSSDIPRRYIV
jgi:hypothetical protein